MARHMYWPSLARSTRLTFYQIYGVYHHPRRGLSIHCLLVCHRTDTQKLHKYIKDLTTSGPLIWWKKNSKKTYHTIQSCSSIEWKKRRKKWTLLQIYFANWVLVKLPCHLSLSSSKQLWLWMCKVDKSLSLKIWCEFKKKMWPVSMKEWNRKYIEYYFFPQNNAAHINHKWIQYRSLCTKHP